MSNSGTFHGLLTVHSLVLNRTNLRMTNHYFRIHHFNQQYFMHKMWFVTNQQNSTKHESLLNSRWLCSLANQDQLHVFFPTIISFLKPSLYIECNSFHGNGTYDSLTIGP